jgi:hypothetical protein
MGLVLPVWLLAGAGLAPGDGAPAPSASPAEDRSFARQVRPLLARHCLRCHNATRARADLDLSRPETVLHGGRSGPSVRPGHSDQSLLCQVLQPGHAPHMPPQAQLTAAEVAAVAAWVDALTARAAGPGRREVSAEDRDFWSFRPVRRPAVPAARSPEWVRNPIDAFILAALDARGLAPSAPADRRTLIRRATFDLVGLPPAPEEVSAFLADDRPDAYERLIERLLASPAYGERWARHWQDLARYADSGGYMSDAERPFAFRYRDWLIRAFNADQPYDRFVLEQLAGDELDEPEALPGTGFCCNAPTTDNQESEKIRCDELDDMLSTAASVFLGLTVGCARCHDHKYDPIPQRDYYRLLACFNNSVRRNLSAGPPAQRALSRELARQLEELRAEFAALVAPVEYGSGKWRRDGQELVQENLDGDARLFFGSRNWTDYTFEVEAQKTGGAEGFVVLFRAANPRNLYRFTAGGQANRRHAVECEVDDRPSAVGEPAAGSVEAGRWYRLRVEARGQQVRCSVDGRVVLECRNERYPRGQVGLGSSATAVRYRNLRVTGPDGNVLFEGLPALDNNDLRPPIQREDRRPRIEQQIRTIAEVEQRLAATAPAPCLVEEGPPVRRTFVLLRGDVRLPSEEVQPGVPAVLAPAQPPFPPPPPGAHGSGRRLALARWVASPDNPLTARVMVNRVWQHHFGRGLVETASDFGRRGARPSHPELLDWLADEFVRTGWSLKALHRLVMTSAAYRQSSAGNPAGGRLDAEGRYLWRFPPRRLEAEAIRDSILAASGNLNRQMFGPGVKPRVPPGVLAAAAVTWPPIAREGPEHWRRSVYIFLKRSAPFPLLECFDAPVGTGSCARRVPTTVAPQALLLLNDAFSNEQAEALAARVLREAGPAPARQVERAYWLTLSRPPTPAQCRLGVTFLCAQEQRHREAGLAGPGQAALADLCQVLFNTNEFVYVD